MRLGEDWQIKALAASWSGWDWWQTQVDITQLAIYQLEDRIKEETKNLSLFTIKNMPSQVSILKSSIENDRGNLENYRVWVDICVSEMKRCDLRRRLKEASNG